MSGFLSVAAPESPASLHQRAYEIHISEIFRITNFGCVIRRQANTAIFRS